MAPFSLDGPSTKIDHFQQKISKFAPLEKKVFMAKRMLKTMGVKITMVMRATLKASSKMVYSINAIRMAKISPMKKPTPPGQVLKKP